ncbi:MAG: hypothetical protein NC251_07745 [Lachnoclostridium sp.]|nr:hypothetical protein [Lachnospira sp.]MCM1248305.1 hypothetical protein [Lachnoclostridium sp.]
MKQKIIGYIAAAVIGVGFIMMAVSNTLHNETASVLQGILGAAFITVAMIKIISEYKKGIRKTPS